MADQTRIVKILIDDPQAQRSLENLQKKATALETKMKKFDPGTKQWKDLDAELKQVNAQISTLHGQISGKLGASIGQMEAEQKKLNKAIKQMPVELRKASEEYKRLQLISGQLRQIRNEANENAKQLGNVKDRIGRLADGFNKYMGMITATLAAFTGVILGLRKAKQLYDEFEASVANLSALTGLQGQELEYLKEKAIELSQSVVDGSIRITKSAKEIADAFTIVGSQRPELLQNKEALAEVTKQALILAEAAQIDLQTAVKGVTTSLNQFNLEGKEAARVNNVLAAGSKVGAANVSYQAEALEKSGTAMKYAKIEIEEGIGLIQTLAPRFAAPEMAGTQLKNVILKLETAVDKNLRPSVVGLLPALENLKNKNWDATKMLHFFGQENITAASILVDYKHEVADYTKAVTNTSIALDQASTNTDTNKAKMAQARNELNNNLMILGSKFSPMIVSATGLLNKLFVTLTKLPQFWKENRQEILYFGIALIGLRLNAVVAMIQSVSTAVGAATISFRAFTAAIRANPFGLAIAAVSTLIGLIGVFGKKSKEAAAENSNLFDSTRRTIEVMDEERTTLNKLFDQLEKTTTGSIQRQKVIDEINSKYGTTLKKPER
ncbi:phage tail tape measure protein [Oscillatoria amoena NRMC-F 0135]|nr:phage tail tape measure protein [Oscillatoria amoena NRMC-F 0135]